MLPPLRPSDKSAPTVNGDKERAKSKPEEVLSTGAPVDSRPQTERLPEVRTSDMQKKEDVAEIAT